MSLFIRPFGQLLLLAALLFSTIEQATAQAQASKARAQAKPPVTLDSSKVYTYVERMPVYPGGGGTKALTADFLREFRSASATAGCSPPTPVFVSFTVGPSGVIYNVASVNNVISVNNQPAPNNLPKLSAACEGALVAAASKLPRFTPGTQNRRRVAVTITLKLAEPTP
ncbi:hypothetical protein [Hymenobacter sp. YC55]|uniref:hypothetical protein n=1 Tax=Hymenobacter sp. YC55 TaxID=3034019 RepID=UPI0023F79F38|nr:hypothetical protein [Hymenobacter sp. YC55]MDF7814322.1 hypothetical protein [Hymenobacter sp. YC55]